MAVAFPTAAAATQTLDLGDAESGLPAAGTGAGDPFAALLASAGEAACGGAVAIPLPSGAAPDPALDGSDPAEAGVCEQLLCLFAIPAVPTLIEPTAGTELAEAARSALASGSALVPPADGTGGIAGMASLALPVATETDSASPAQPLTPGADSAGVWSAVLAAGRDGAASPLPWSAAPATDLGTPGTMSAAAPTADADGMPIASPAAGTASAAVLPQPELPATAIPDALAVDQAPPAAATTVATGDAPADPPQQLLPAQTAATASAPPPGADDGAAAAAPTDPLRALVLGLRPAERRNAIGTAPQADPAPSEQPAPAATDLLPASEPEAGPPSPGQRPERAEPVHALPSPPIEAPPPAGISAAALQVQPATRVPPQGESHAAAGETPAALTEALRPAQAGSDQRAALEAPAPRASAPPTPVDRAIAGQVARQLVRTTADGDRTMVLRLTPPELGTVRIELREHAGTLTAHLVVEDAAVARAIDRMLPAMRQELRAQESPLADVVREPKEQQRQNDGRGQPQDQAAPWSRQQEREGNRQGRRQGQPVFTLAGLADGDPAPAGTELARPLR